MFELIGSIFGSVFAGGATGILGIIAQRYADYKNKQLDISLEQQRQANAVVMKELDAKIMAAEAAANLAITTVETTGRSDVADAEAFGKSFEMEPERYAGGELSYGQKWLMVFLDFMRGSVRPGLTIYLCVLVTLVYFQAAGISKEALDSTQAFELMQLIISTILYLATTCLLWWFGTRNKGGLK